jgi:hypothetical protein
MRERPQPKRLVVQTLGTSRAIRLTVYDDEAREFVERDAAEFGALLQDRYVNNVYLLEISDAYDQIEVEAYIASRFDSRYQAP